MSFAGSQWYATVTIDHTLVDADEPDFRLLITAANAPTGLLDSLSANPAKNGGGDLLAYLEQPFVGAEPATRFPIHVEGLTLAAGAGGECEVYAGIPNASSSVDSVIYLVWGDASASQPARSALYGSVFTRGRSTTK